MAVKLNLPNNRLWILDPWRDLALFVLVPLWIIPVVWWAKANFNFTSFGAIALALGGVGHHLPGFIRAYTDPVLFRRFRTRFVVAPLFFLTVFAAFSLRQLHGLEVIVVMWGAWHGAMQVNGFLRIYDAKAGSVSPLTANLDRAMCIAWFAAALLHSTSRATAILMNFYSAGVPAIDPGVFGAFRVAWDIFTGCITAAFLINAWRQARLGVTPSPIKFLLMASSFGFYWFAMVTVYNPILGLLLFEIFHDIQYNTLVWAYNRARVTRHLGASRLEAFLFRPGAFRVVLYAVLVLAYGTLGVFSGYSAALVPSILGPAPGSIRFWTGLFTVSAFLHFYFDGFIWQVREKELRQSLDIAGRKEERTAVIGTARALNGPLPAGWKWAFFIVPAVFLSALELRRNVPPMLEQFRNIVGILPESWSLHYMIGHLEKADKQYERSMEDYARSISVNPDFQPAHAELADVQAHVGRDDLALPHYLRAAELDSLDYDTRDHLATTLLTANRVREALPHLLATAARKPNDTNLIYLTGAALMHENRPEEAVPYLKRTLSLDPGQPRAWSYLGVAAHMRGDSASADEYYHRA
ncbi:MAG: tetratricopeptide repeat protein, partial [Fibrobacteria bacterium]